MTFVFPPRSTGNIQSPPQAIIMKLSTSFFLKTFCSIFYFSLLYSTLLIHHHNFVVSELTLTRPPSLHKHAILSYLRSQVCLYCLLLYARTCKLAPPKRKLLLLQLIPYSYHVFQRLTHSVSEPFYISEVSIYVCSDPLLSSE